MNNALAIALGIGALAFAIVLGLTNGFSNAPVASSDTSVHQSSPTVDDDIDRGYLPGHTWINQSGGSAWIAISVSDGAADWNQID